MKHFLCSTLNEVQGKTISDCIVRIALQQYGVIRLRMDKIKTF